MDKSSRSISIFERHSLIDCPPIFLQIMITQSVIQGVYPGVTTVELDTLAAETAASFTIKHPDYAILAARIAVSNLHKQTKKAFSGELPCLVFLSSSFSCFSVFSHSLSLILACAFLECVVSDCRLSRTKKKRAVF